MRHSVLKGLEAATTISKRNIATASPRTPFVCAHCRQAALRTSAKRALASRRPFATVASRRQQASSVDARQSREQESPSPHTHYDFFPDTFPNGLPPKSPFTPDLRQLRKEFLQQQSKTHPDLAPASQKRQAEAMSMRVNEAYKTLQDPLKRAQYLLSLQGIDVEDDSAKLSENELLMEVMEAREAVEEVENEEDLVGIRAENNERIAASVQILESAFAQTEMEQAAQEAIRLRYWMNIEESIQGWEKGKGGGVIHH